MHNMRRALSDEVICYRLRRDKYRRGGSIEEFDARCT